MRTIHYVHVEVNAPPMSLTRKLYFATKVAADSFRAYADRDSAGFTVKGFGIEHTLSVADALREVEKEKESMR